MAGSRTFRVQREWAADVVIKADEFKLIRGTRVVHAEFNDNEKATGAQGEYTRHIPVATVRDPLLVEELRPDSADERILTGNVRRAAERAVEKHGACSSAANQVIIDTGCGYFEAKAAVDTEVARRCSHRPGKVVATIILSGPATINPEICREFFEEYLAEVIGTSSYAASCESVVVGVS